MLGDESTTHQRAAPMPVSHSAQYEPTHSDVWTVLEALPHRIKALLWSYPDSVDR